MDTSEFSLPPTGADLAGLINATTDGGAYDALPVTLTGAQWATLAPYLRPQPAPTGMAPIREGELDRTLFFLESGTLTVHRGDGLGRMRLAVLAPGTVVGEGAFFSGQPRSATVVATRASMLWRLEYERFHELSAREPATALALAMACAAVVVRRLNHIMLQAAIT